MLYKNKIPAMLKKSVVIFILSLCFLFLNINTAYSWWNYDWHYRKPIIIDHQTVNDYQIYITISALDGGNNLIGNNKLQADYSDVRFTDENNSPISYCSDNYFNVDGSTAGFWIKVPAILSAGTTIYFYYGNASTTTTQSPDDTFVHMDAFNNLNKWVDVNAQIFEIITDGSRNVLHIEGGSQWRYGRSRTTYELLDTKTEIMLKAIDANSDLDFSYGLETGNYSAWVGFMGLAHFRDTAGGWTSSRIYVNNGFVESEGPDIDGTYRIYETIVTAGWVRGIYRGETITNWADPGVTNTNLVMGTGDDTGSGIYIDWIRISKYADPEPNTNVKLEETIYPFIQSAETVDDDLNGKIDAYHIIFSTPIDDSTIGLTTHGFDVEGYGGEIFISTGLPNRPDIVDDNQIFIRFDEGTLRDTGLKPELTYSKDTGQIRSLFLDKYLLDVGIATVIETDGAAPIIHSATAFDDSTLGEGVHDGDVVRIYFSESVDAPPDIINTNIDSILNSTFNFNWTWLDGEGNISPDGADWVSASYLEIWLSSSPAGAPDIMGGYIIQTTTYSFKDSSNNVSSHTVILGGNFGLSGGGDTTPPSIHSRGTCDLDLNGYIDAVHITFSEPISDITVYATNFTLLGAGELSFSTGTAGDTQNDSDIYLTFTETETLRTDATPNVVYTQGSLADLAGNEMVSLDGICSDKASPIIFTAVAKDNFKNVLGVDNDDTVIITFSEKTNAPLIDFNNIDGVLNVLGLNGIQTWGSIDPLASWNAERDILTVYLSTDGAISPTITVGSTITPSVEIKDVSPSANSCAGVIDITGSFDIPNPPTIISARTIDTNLDGWIDSYQITFSHKMDTTTFKLSYWGVVGHSTESFKTELNGERIYISFSTSGVKDTAVVPQLMYSTDTFKDMHNQPLNIEDGIIESDGAAPIIITAVASDDSGGGPGIQTGDKITINFTEAVDGPPVISAGNIDEILNTTVTFKDGSGFIGAADWSGLNSILTITLSVSVSTPPTISPGHLITTDFITFKDSARNVSSHTIVLSGSFGVDTSSPAILSRETRDLNSDGYIDSIFITFNESIDDGTIIPSSFTVGGIPATGFNTGSSVDDNEIYIIFPETNTLKTDATPTLECKIAAVKDISGNPVVYSNEACTDKSPPAILSAVASDEDVLRQGVDSDDKLIITFSENTNRPMIDASNIDQVLLLSGTTSWEDASGDWNTDGNILTISFGSDASSDVVKVGDIVSVSSATVQIVDSKNNICVDSATITGAFTGEDVTSPVIISFLPKSDAIGVGIDEVVEVNFNERMDINNVASAVSVRAIKDNLGQSINDLILGSINEAGSQFIFTPASLFKNNFTYRLTISTTATDTIGNHLQKEFVSQFTTISNHSKKNIFISTAPKTTVVVEPGALTKNYSIRINTTPLTSAKIIRANNTLIMNADRFSFPLNYTMREFNLYDSKNNRIRDNFKNKVNVQIPYKDENNDGFVDDTLPKVSEKSLSIYYLKEENNIWVRIPSEVDEVNNIVSANVPHFTVFMISGSNLTDLSKAYAFPVPFMPSEGHDEIIFTNLSSEAVIKIYTVSGSLVATLNETDGDYIYKWSPVVNSEGKKVASGVYIYHISNKEDSKTGKLIVIR